MNPIGYNPTPDGLAAKAWECLRRNKEFRSNVDIGFVTGWQNSDPMPEDPPDRYEDLVYLSVTAAEDNNRVAEIVFDCSDEAWGTDVIWPNLPDQIKSKLSRLFKSPSPQNIYSDFPTFTGGMTAAFQISPKGYPHMFSEQSRKNYSESKGLDPLAVLEIGKSMEDLLIHHSLVAIPKYVRDGAHHKAVLESLKGLMPKPRHSTRALNPTAGAMMGTESAWVAFLTWEKYKDQVPISSRLSGICYTAVTQPDSFETGSMSVRELQDLIETDPESLCLPSSLGNEKWKEIDELGSRRGAEVEKRYLDPIKQAIELSYPRFEIFGK